MHDNGGVEMKNIRNIIVMILALVTVGLFTSCDNNIQGPEVSNTELEQPVSEPTAIESEEQADILLIAGKNMPVGTVEVTNDKDNLYLDITTDANWSLTEIQLHIGKTIDDFPLAGRSGNPVPGKFDYADKTIPNLTEYRYTVSLDDWAPNDELMIALHAEVQLRSDGTLIEKEGAWAAGQRFTERGNWATYFFYTIEEAGLLVSNTLASPEEIARGLKGVGGTIVGDVNFNHYVNTSYGVTPNTGYARSGVDFPTTIVDPERGTVEMWAQFYSYPQPYSHGVYGFVNVNHWRVDGIPDNVMVFAWHNSHSQLNFGLRFNGNEYGTSLTNFRPPLFTPVHLACVWDREGIDGTGDYMRIYVDGVLVAVNNSNNGWGNDNTAGAFRVAAPWDSNFGTDRYTVANLKVWDHAKTDF